MYKVQIENQIDSLGYKEKKFLFYKSALKHAQKFEGIIFDRTNHLCKSFISNKSINFIPEKNNENTNYASYGNTIMSSKKHFRSHIVGEYFKTQKEYCALRTLMQYIPNHLSKNKDINLILSDIFIELYGYQPHFLIDFKNKDIKDDLKIFNEPLITKVLPEFIPNYIDVKNNCYTWYKDEAIDLYNRCFKDNKLYFWDASIGK
jgi:hypothetical protein